MTQLSEFAPVIVISVVILCSAVLAFLWYRQFRKPSPTWEPIGLGEPFLPRQVVGPLVANKAKLEDWIGRQISEDAFSFVPWGERLVVVREEPVRRTSSGLHIPQGSQEMPTVGWILSIGDKVDSLNCPGERELLLGTKVLFGMYAGQVLMVGDADDFQDSFNSRYTLLDAGSIWGRVGDQPREPLL